MEMKKYISTIRLYNLTDVLTFSETKGQTVEYAIKNNLAQIAFYILHKDIFALDDYTFEYALSQPQKMRQDVLDKHKAKRNLYKRDVLLHNEQFDITKWQYSIDQEKYKVRLYKLSYNMSFGKFKDRSVEDLIKTNPTYFEFLIKSNDSFGITPSALKQLNKLCPEYVFLAETILIISYKINIAPDFMKGRISNRNYYNDFNNNDWDYDTDSDYDEYGGPSDGYGGRLDDDFINDALGGQADAIWNIN